MRLLRLEARDWLSYADLDLDFSELEQVVVVGQNGHGKSALLDALLYCLFGRGRASADQMVRTGALNGWVRSTWLINGHEVQVTRTRSLETKAGDTSLQVSVNGQRHTKHTIAETQDFIEALIGLPVDVLLATAVMVQGRSDELMRATPAARKEYLVSLFGLGMYDSLHSQAKDRAAEAKGGRQATEAQIKALKDERGQLLAGHDIDHRVDFTSQQLARTTKLREDLADQIATVREEAVRLREREQRVASLTKTIDAGNSAINAANAELASWEANLEAAQEQAKTPKPTLDSVPDPKDIDAIRSKLEEHRLTERQLLTSVGIRDQWQAQLNRLELAEHLVSSVPCQGAGEFASCRFLVDAKDRSLLNEARQQVSQYVDLDNQIARSRTMVGVAERSLNEAVAYEETRQEIKTNNDRKVLDHTMLIAKAEGEVVHCQRTVEALKDRLAAANAEVARLQAERMPLQQDFSRIEEVVTELKDLTAKWETAKQDAEHWANTKAEAVASQKRYREIEAQLDILSATLARHVADQDVYSVLADAFHRDGVPTLILENGLPAIEAKANDVLEQMPGGFHLEFITQKGTKSGTVKETLDVNVQVDGQERPYELLSGGERFRVDFALRVGLASVLGHRAGTSIRTLWLDEPLAALDANGREAVLDSLASVTDDFDLIVVVSHHDEFSDRMPARISVAKSDGVSTALVV